MKPSILILLTSQFILNNYIEGCCNKKKNNYKYEDFYLKYIENDFSTTNEKWKNINYDNIVDKFNKVIDYEKNNKIKYDKDDSKNGFKIKKIDWKKLKKITNLEWDVNINELKKQINFIEKISYIYELYFFLMLLTYGDSIFSLTVNGAGGSILYPASFLNQKVNILLREQHNKDFTNILKNYQMTDNKTSKHLKRIFIDYPYIYKHNDCKMFTMSKIPLMLINGVNINFSKNNRRAINDYINFLTICEYLAQLGNPIYAITNDCEKDIAIIYNSLCYINKIFQGNLPFINNLPTNDLDIIKETKKNIEYVKDKEILAQIKELGAVGEQDMILLAEVIVLNNILYDVYKFAEYNSKNIISNITFSSYGGKVFELLMSLIKNNYENISECVDNDHCVFVEKNSLNTLFIHGLLGANKVKENNNDLIIINNNKIIKSLGSAVVSNDRLQCFNIKTLFGNTFIDIIKFYNEKVNEHKIIQIISKFKENNSTDIVKSTFKFEFDNVISSLYKSKYYDGLLSDDAIFVYNNDDISNKIKNIIKNNIESPFNKNNYFILSDNKITQKNIDFNINFNKKDGIFIIDDNDNNIKYIHIGSGNHLNNEKKINNEAIYDGRGLLVDELLEYTYNK